jgi:hypothetical protein
MAHVEKLKKCHELIKKSTGVDNIIDKQQSGHTASIPKKAESQPAAVKLDVKLPVLHTNSKHLRMGDNEAATTRGLK